MKHKGWIAVLVLVYMALALAAQEKAAAAAAPLLPPAVDRESVTRHVVVIGGQPLAYIAAAGMLPIRDAGGKTMAHIFYIAYTREGTGDRSRRPLLFAFNGGPGSSSVWLHMGFLGPRRVAYDPEGFMRKPPFTLVDNGHSILDVADLVFIDPVATGFSRMAAGEDPHRYHGVMEDLESMGEFIRLYLTRSGRWASPKFLIGESYGTTRAAGLCGTLQGQHRIYLNGAILVSSMTLGVRPGDDVELALVLPHYAATAWYHRKLPADLQGKTLAEVLREAEAFALGPYLDALVRGGLLPAAEMERMASELSRFTGIEPGLLRRLGLRLDRVRFRQELLAREGRVVGRLDSRYSSPVSPGSTLSPFDADPAMSEWSGPFTAAVNHYFRAELKYETDLPYAIFGDVRPWKGMAEANVGALLRQALVQNPYLRILVLSGYYDGATDYLGMRYSFSHIDGAGSFRDRIGFRFYECGHMMYVREADLVRAKKDLAEFILAGM